jgi:peptidyl-prolyl cis-trans isomerase D
MILTSFRNASKSIFVKILFGTIILSFCLWGVGDIIKNYNASKTVFSVEKTKITAEQFLREYNNEKQQIKDSKAGHISKDELVALNIKNRVLDRLVNSAVLEQMYNKMDIKISKKSILDIVRSLPAFQNNGVFSEKIYEMTLKKAGINEAGFLTHIKDNLARTQLFHPIVAGYKIPEFIKERIVKEYEMKSTFLLARIKVDSMKYTSIPTKDELVQYYKNNLEKYKKPETRDVSVMLVDYKKLASDIVINEEEINEYYLKNKDAYKTVEKRDFERFVFDAKNDADKAWAMMKKGTSSRKIVKKLLPDMEVIKGMELSHFSKDIGTKLFKLKLNGVSDVHVIGEKYHIYKLVRVEKPKEKTEHEIKAEILKILQNEKINSPEFYVKIKEMRNKVDDGFGAGKSIEEIAGETKSQIFSFNDLSKVTGYAQIAKIIPDKDTSSEIMETIYSLEEQQASQIIDSKTSDNIFYVVFVKKITQESIPPFEKVDDQVKKNYVFEKKNKNAQDMVNKIVGNNKETVKMVKKIAGVKKFKFSKEDLIMHQQYKSKDVENVLKEIPNLNVVFNIVTTLKKGQSTYYKISENEYIIAAIENVEESPKSKPEFKEVLLKSLDQGTANDVFPVALGAFKEGLKIKIDDHLLNEITCGNKGFEEDN